MAKSPRKAPSHALDCSQYNHTIIWDSVDQYETIHPLLHQVLCIVKRKLQNGMATMYGGDDPLQEVMSVPGTFRIVPYIENDQVLEEQLQLDSKDQMDAMAMGYTLPDGIYFNYDLVTARTECYHRLGIENKIKGNDVQYTAYKTLLECVCEQELANAKDQHYSKGSSRQSTHKGTPMQRGYVIEDRLQRDRMMGNSASPRLIMVKPHAQRNRYRNIELFYAFRDSEGLLHLDEQTQHKSLGMLEMYPYFRYFPYHAMWLALV